MTLRLYNTLTRRQEEFVPLDPANIRMYVCGPTVYDFAHIGNARPVIVFDVLFRLLRHLYGPEHVTYARNITDVDDKIIARAAEEGVAIDDLTERTTRQFHDDVAALGCLPPTLEPRATEHIPEMIAMIARLIDTGNAYVAEGHVLFHVPSMPDYGKLARRSLDDMRAGARVEVAPYKRDPMDFVLWKPSKDGEPGWDSPWGLGRPGWHIECSAMSAAHLGEVFDIHGGGIDLVFPHHENELAQSRCAHGTEIMARYWMHNGFLQVEGEKMSKSLGNFMTINDLLRCEEFGGKRWPGYAVRLAMLQAHYRDPLDWTVASLRQAEIRVKRWRDFASHRTSRKLNKTAMQDFINALSDDLNTPEALHVIDKLAKSSRATSSDMYSVYRMMKFVGLRSLKSDVAKLSEHMLSIVNIMSNMDKNDILQIYNTALSKPKFASGKNKPETVFVAAVYRLLRSNIQDLAFHPEASDLGDMIFPRRREGDDFKRRVETLVAARTEARKAKDFAEADRIRDELAAMGIALKDGPEGTTWEVAR